MQSSQRKEFCEPEWNSSVIGPMTFSDEAMTYSLHQAVFSSMIEADLKLIGLIFDFPFLLNTEKCFIQFCPQRQSAWIYGLCIELDELDHVILSTVDTL